MFFLFFFFFVFFALEQNDTRSGIFFSESEIFFSVDRVGEKEYERIKAKPDEVERERERACMCVCMRKERKQNDLLKGKNTPSPQNRK